MPITLDHAYSRGMVSPKARARALTLSQGSAKMGLKGKVVGFDSSQATDEYKPDKGKVPKNEINNREQQHRTQIAKGWVIGVGGHAGKGEYKSAKGGQPTRDAINAPGNAKKFPASSKVKKGNLRYRTRGNSGGSDTNKGGDGKYYYGGPNSNER